MFKLNFNTQDKSNWGDLQAQVSDELIKCLASGKSFSVEFGELKESKSNQQLKGYWRICSLVVPHIQKEWGEIVDKEEVSNTAKLAIGYSVKIGQQITPKSLTKATKEEIGRAHV